MDSFRYSTEDLSRLAKQHGWIFIERIMHLNKPYVKVQCAECKKIAIKQTHRLKKQCKSCQTYNSPKVKNARELFSQRKKLLEEKGIILLEDEYKGSGNQTLYRARCKRCNKESAHSLHYFLYLTFGCKECFIKDRTEKQVQVMIQRVKEQAITKNFEYLVTTSAPHTEPSGKKYLRYSHKMKCLGCGRIAYKRRTIIDDCLVCANRRKIDFDEIKKKLAAKNFTIQETEYKGVNAKYKVVCNGCKRVRWPRLSDLLSTKYDHTCTICVPGKLKSDYNIYRQQIINSGLLCLTTEDEYRRDLRSYLKYRCPVCGLEHKTMSQGLRRNERVYCLNCNVTKTQTILAKIIEDVFKCKIETSYRGHTWLKYKARLELDIWVEQYKLAIEYDGAQHFMPVRWWGANTKTKAAQKFEEIKQRDKIKNELIASHPEQVKYFIRFNYKEKITTAYVIKKLLAFGVPIPITDIKHLLSIA